MNKQFTQYIKQVDALSLRERALILITLIVLPVYSWWAFSGSATLQKTKLFEKQNTALQSEIDTLELTSAAIQKRIQDGVHKDKQQKLDFLKKEFDRVSALLEEKTNTLIEPDEMFELMQQLIFAESKLKLTAMKRKEVQPALVSNSTDGKDSQPEIYRHVLRLSFEGRFKDILQYIQKLEALQWQLIWDRITLKMAEYPIIKVDIEISTFSDNKNWVGL